MFVAINCLLFLLFASTAYSSATNYEAPEVSRVFVIQSISDIPRRVDLEEFAGQKVNCVFDLDETLIDNRGNFTDLWHEDDPATIAEFKERGFTCWAATARRKRHSTQTLYMTTYLGIEFDDVLQGHKLKSAKLGDNQGYESGILYCYPSNLKHSTFEKGPRIKDVLDTMQANGIDLPEILIFVDNDWENIMSVYRTAMTGVKKLFFYLPELTLLKCGAGMEKVNGGWKLCDYMECKRKRTRQIGGMGMPRHYYCYNSNPINNQEGALFLPHPPRCLRKIGIKEECWLVPDYPSDDEEDSLSQTNTLEASSGSEKQVV